VFYELLLRYDYLYRNIFLAPLFIPILTLLMFGKQLGFGKCQFWRCSGSRLDFYKNLRTYYEIMDIKTKQKLEKNCRHYYMHVK